MDRLVVSLTPCQWGWVKVAILDGIRANQADYPAITKDMREAQAEIRKQLATPIHNPSCDE